MPSKIKELREKRNLTQADLAKRLGVTRSLIAKWETGQATPRTIILAKLAHELKCKVEFILP